MTLAKRTRILYLLLSICSLICLICIGFSSWTIVSEVTKTAGGSLIASPVVDHSEYITCQSVQCFDFNEDGFTGNNATEDGNFGYIIVEYSLDASACSNIANTNGDIDITLYLRGVDWTGKSLVFYRTGAETAVLKITNALIQLPNSGVWEDYIGYSSYNGDYLTTKFTSSISDIEKDSTFSVQYSVTYVGSTTDDYKKLYELLVELKDGQPVINETTGKETTAQFYCHGRVEKAS